MPARYFPFSQEFNSDPEGWELTDLHGDRMLRVWMEILAIGDRNHGVLKGTVEQWAPLLARKVFSTGNPRWIKRDVLLVKNAMNWMIEKGWLKVFREGSETLQKGFRDASDSSLKAIRSISEPYLEIANYAKYHKVRAEHSLPPNPPNHPNHKNHKNDSRQQPKTAVDDPVLFEQEKTPKPELTVKDLVESWNEWFAGKLPTVELPLATSRHKKAAARLREHQNLDFWKKVFEQIGASAFLMGRNNGTWRCTFDFLVANDTNAIKIFEGSYNR